MHRTTLSEVREKLNDMEEPKFKIYMDAGRKGDCAKKEVSTAQVQFWPDYVEAYERSIDEHTQGFVQDEVIRVDLMTNEYYPDFVMRLDRGSHGPILEQTLRVLDNS